MLTPHALHRLFYVSRAHIDPCGPEPRRILDVATERNNTLGVTGLLCFSGDHFAQVLEGGEQPLEELMRSITADERHTLLRIWPARPAGDERWFPGWAMAYTFDERLEEIAQHLVDHLGDEIPLDRLAPALFHQLELYRGPLHAG